ncbi:hypothetical protein F0U61_41160 [Archangium violaceum]|uniref:hypothetical protein n=1 Tax=Archangium violaceum TaxID=83451 RepID=UPI002B2A575C|nr:hypothetical protein F0U61_41160 [Archangium violaceum]
MASFDSFGPAFDKDTPVLRLNYGKDPNARWVLWPLFAWRVVAPVPKEYKLNLFQRAVLGLARAGVVRIDEVGDRLLIAPDLAGLVALELQQMDLLDHAGKPTKRGLTMLEDIEEEPADEAQVGHVLSDAFTGKLWPRFLTGDLPVADVQVNDDGWPVLLSGSAGDPWKDRTFSILPTGRDGVVMVRPSARDVLRAARLHRRQRQRDFEEIDDDRDVPRLQRVSFVDDRPQPYLLALRVCRHDSGDWMVDDPFGHGEAVDLRARLEERLDSHKGLRPWLAPLVGSDSSAPTLGQFQAEAAWRVEERLTLAIRQHEAARDRLVAMQRALLEAQSYDAPLDKWDDVLVKAQRAVERALHIVYERYRNARPPLFTKLAQSDWEFNRRLLDAMAADLNFQSPLPKTLSSVRRGKVQSAEQYGGGTLRPLVVLGLLCADRDDAHPLRRAARTSPDLLHRLDDLATARDRAAHDGTATWPQKVQRHVDTAYAAVEALLLAR